MNGARELITAAAEELQAEKGLPQDRPRVRALSNYLNGKSFTPGWGHCEVFDEAIWISIAEYMGIRRPPTWDPFLWATNIKGQISLLAIPDHKELPDDQVVLNVLKWCDSALKVVM